MRRRVKPIPPASDQEPPRTKAYRALLEELGIDPNDMSYSGGEDAGEWLAGDNGPIGQFCVTTASGDFVYTYPKYASLEAAAAFAFDNIDDPEFAETPTMIVDLDTGERYEPDYSTVVWRQQPKD